MSRHLPKSFSENPKSAIQNRKWAGIVALVVALAMCGVMAQAQQPKKFTRIGYLSAVNPASETTRSAAIRQELRELGYIEGQNIAIEYRYGERKSDRAPELAAELVRLNVDVIVVSAGGNWVRPPRMQPKRFPSLWRDLGVILSSLGWLKALPVPAATSPA
jgi:hypothetical protein